MTNRLTAACGTGKAIYFLAFSSAKVLNVSTLTLDSVPLITYGNYIISALEIGTTGVYDAAFPTGAPSANYDIFPFEAVNGLGNEAQGDPFAAGGFNFDVSTATTATPVTPSNSAAYYTSKLAAIDAAIDALLARPRPNYKIGNTQMDYADLLLALEKSRDRCLQLLQSMQSESFETLNTDVNVFGQDIADYINESSE